MLYERYKELTEDIDSLLTDRPRVNVMLYSEAIERICEDEPQTDEHCETCRHKDECEGATYEYKNTEWWCLAYAPIDEPQTDCDHKCIQTEIGCEKPDCPWK